MSENLSTPTQDKLLFLSFIMFSGKHHVKHQPDISEAVFPAMLCALCTGLYNMLFSCLTSNSSLNSQQANMENSLHKINFNYEVSSLSD